jgi:drug/metabolite transporter (DMT)-like permease
MRDTVDESLSRKGMFHLCLVYVLWSTTYLAMRIGVASANGFPPFVLGALRMPVAAAILLAMARLQGLKMRPARSEWLSLAVGGNLLWLGGNGSILWAEQYAASGFSCLMASSAPIWATIIELLLYRKRPTIPLVVSLLVGFAGIAILSSTSLTAKGPIGFWVVLVLILAPSCWALGSVVQARRPVSLHPQVISGYQHLMAFFGFLFASLLVGERVPHPGLSAWLAWGYLVIFGSVIAFTSFITSLRLLPISIAMTYAYVNPVLALFLGWLLLGEPITARTMVGAGLVIIGVFAVFRVKQGTSLRADD